MASVINASSSGAGGLVSSGDSSGVLQLQNNGSTSVTLDTSGNVGIGITSPAVKLDVGGNGQFTASSSQISFIDSSNSNYKWSIQGTSSAIRFYDNTASAERMRIDSSGNLLVGGTTAFGSLQVSKAAITANGGQLSINSPTAGDSNICGMSITKFANDTTTAQVFVRFGINNGASGCGQINANGANTAAFGSYSDSRLKENIVDLPSQLNNIMALRPVEYDYIESMGGGHQIGFVAQEVQVIYPDLVGETEDGMLTLTDMNKNDARLIKAIQELKALVDTQASTITALQANIAAKQGS